MHAAADAGDLAAVRHFIAAGADVNRHDYMTQSPLHKSSYKGHSAIVMELLQANACVNDADHFGYTPLHFASERGHFGVVVQLLDAKAEVDARSKSTKITPLITASSKYPEIAELLIRSKAYVNACDSLYQTALHIAVASGHGSLVGLLIHTQADVNAVSHSGTPMKIAYKYDRVDIAAQLLQAGVSASYCFTPFSRIRKAALCYPVGASCIYPSELRHAVVALLACWRHPDCTHPLVLLAQEHMLLLVQALHAQEVLETPA